MAEQQYIRRGMALSIFLGVLIVGSFLTAIAYVVFASRFGLPGTPPAWIPYVMAMLGLLVSIFSLAAWSWKKAGIIGLFILAVAVGGLNYYIGLRTEILPLLAYFVILLFLVRPVWKYFR